MIEIERLPISEITVKHLDALVTAKAMESQTLEFKQELKIGTDSDKREFCTDVVSFANASGGLVLYGIRADKGTAVEVLGLSVASTDDLVLQAEQILHSGISPRIPWKAVHPISLANGRFIIAIKVQRSAIAPHAAGKDGVFRFFTRGSGGKLGMDIPQVRSSFLLSEGLRERLRAFRADRMGRIIANDGIALLPKGAKLIVHLVPLKSLIEATEYNVIPFHPHSEPSLVSLGASYASSTLTEWLTCVGGTTLVRPMVIRSFTRVALSKGLTPRYQIPVDHQSIGMPFLPYTFKSNCLGR